MLLFTLRLASRLLIPVSLGLAGAACQSAEQDTLAVADRAGAAVEVTAAEAQALLAGDADVVVLDVRTAVEFDSGHIRHAINVDFRSADFATRLASLDTTRTYLLHCASGRRSAAALVHMKENGFRSIYHLTSGLRTWIGAGGSLDQ